MDAHLKSQIEYYSARAAEYDEWFYRKGRYDQGEAENQQWAAEAEEFRQRLLAMGPVESALELAGGTGIWTAELSKIAHHLEVIDASAEMLNINRAKLQNPQITYQQADLFTWEPQKQYDLVFFSFWLSHVPQAKLNPFLAQVAKALKPTGHVVMLDSRASSTSTAHNQSTDTTQDQLQHRILNNGQEYNIYKIYYEPEQLYEEFRRVGIHANVFTTSKYFICAVGQFDSRN